VRAVKRRYAASESDREDAPIGVLMTMERPTRPMCEEAASSGFLTSSWGDHARLHILTVPELLGGQRLDTPLPQAGRTFRKAPRKGKSLRR